MAIVATDSSEGISRTSLGNHCSKPVATLYMSRKRASSGTFLKALLASEAEKFETFLHLNLHSKISFARSNSRILGNLEALCIKIMCKEGYPKFDCNQAHLAFL